MAYLALTFDASQYDRDKLNKLTDKELYDLWDKQETWSGPINAYTLGELSEAWNDDELYTGGTWMYIIKGYD